MARLIKLFGFIPIVSLPEVPTPTPIPTPTPPAPAETEEQKSVRERDEAFAEMRAEENRTTAAAYRDAAQRMRNQRITRLGGAQPGQDPHTR